MIRFHLDEHVDHAIAKGLRARGIDVTTTSDARLLGADDPAHIEFALRENRVVFTNDADSLTPGARREEFAPRTMTGRYQRRIRGWVSELFFLQMFVATRIALLYA